MSGLLVRWLAERPGTRPPRSGMVVVTRVDDEGVLWTWEAGRPARVDDVLEGLGVSLEHAWVVPVEAVSRDELRRELSE